MAEQPGSGLEAYAHLFRLQGPWCTAYVAAGTGTVDTLEAGDVRPGNAQTRLEAQGATSADIQAMGQVLTPAAGVPAPASRFVLVRAGKAEINEVLPGSPILPEYMEVGPVPNLIPLLKHRPEVIHYIVAEVSREHGEIRLYRTGASFPGNVREVEGSSEHVHKFHGGGWSQLRFQHHTEEVWRRNASDVATEIDRVASGSHARLIVLAGDVRARGLVQESLSDSSRALVSEVDSHTHTAGADSADLDDEVNRRVAALWAEEQDAVLDRLALQGGRPNSGSARGVDAVVKAFQQAQVECLIMDDAALSGGTLLALDAEPWVAAAPDEALAAGILGVVPGPAALVRAAALTDARVLLVPGPLLPGNDHVAALLRWHSGPEMPSS
ncbi:hypothetical protein DFO47_103573 [Arthrobacter sp. AG258]|uniref:baeRF2 domain-containing protein n=1 Tax=Arthrobacter sp. AG258 TaxID=2183899 RepID=UPI00105BE588|nr:Vms1/Ankzf1 family peptidyl-tRNA hydrolase [Arthrobacter sp. AG258]TDT81915.1 hypothetical protein DFO47_103573 [Arthrobacter sp. AG258]